MKFRDFPQSNELTICPDNGLQPPITGILSLTKYMNLSYCKVQNFTVILQERLKTILPIEHVYLLCIYIYQKGSKELLILGNNESDMATMSHINILK